MSIGAGHGSYAGDALRSAVLNSTNLFRRQHEAKPLQWDDQLATYAQRYAQNCVWEHSGGPHGENLAENFATPTLAIDAWYAEEGEYDYGEGGFSESTGHFTQLVWEGTRRVGCGAVDCGEANGDQTAMGYFLVCEYDPPGNVIGSFKENVRKPGMDGDGKLGFAGAAVPRLGGISRMLVALVAISSVAVVYL